MAGHFVAHPGIDHRYVDHSLKPLLSRPEKLAFDAPIGKPAIHTSDSAALPWPGTDLRPADGVPSAVTQVQKCAGDA